MRLANLQHHYFKGVYIIFYLLLASNTQCTVKNNLLETQITQKQFNKYTNNKMEVATLGGGCFWCIEAVFLELNGVNSVVSGYAGGSVENPTYKAVCSGNTGHAEVCQITFDPSIISFEEILEVFFTVHDPTTLNRQGNDIGTQYRSVIFYHSEEQKKIAEKVIKAFTDKKIYPNPIVTEISEFKKFYAAEDYHQNYYNNNSDQPYCAYVVGPKVAKFRQKFISKLKKRE
jgi:peptide-methionine (S)-S-oxide reductase